MDQPTLTSDRLALRPFDEQDAHQVQALAGDRNIADTTLRIPHPYLDGMAEAWIAEHAGQYANGTHAVFAIESKDEQCVVGAISLTLELAFRKAELGYWIGCPWWGRGFATEAAHRIVDFGFRQLKLNRIVARHLVRNPASGKVMQKLGMRHEGTLREDTVKWDRFEDLELYSILRREWPADRT